ncbi:extracellular solute-binding protein family 3 [Paenibacillus curdlanolyticus YK9]|uniref:Extracellular solute-binding protein family 3 n=1 Tax=Paenibacillus curdlanolyticus YK9 TaxID=717606 RepID=E0IAN6_9BACL|nr:ABC transporter substrate-binding protein [Paenibacillus curdlanolyticus]EFM10440.1 extracellular solute-binding protein family 3 [Paenibacillus curdlanolyticus YK9]
MVRALSRRFAYGRLLTLLTAAALLLQGCAEGGSGGGAKAAEAQSASGYAGKAATITVGYQSPTAQTWGALIVKNQKLFEKYLKELAPDDDVKVNWFDAPAGSVLNNNMIGGKIQLSFLGDMPSLLNGVLGITQKNYHSVFLAFDGKGAVGRNQAIVVPNGSDIKSIEDLKGKTVSTPIGSSAHRMLLETLRQHGLVDDVKIVDQSVTVGMQSIEQNKIAAHATWAPYPNLIQYKGFGTILSPGEATGIDYLAGVVANRDWAKQNRIYAVAFLKALNEAHAFAKAHPEETARIFEQESGFPPEVCKTMVENIRFDAAIYGKDVSTLKGSAAFLTSIGKLKAALDLDAFIDDSYLREAVKSTGKPYLTDEELHGEWIADRTY